MESIQSEVHQSGPVSILSLQGRLVLGQAANGFRSAVTDMLNAGNRRIVLNFAGVPYADSAGVGALAVSFSNIKAAGGLLAIAETQQVVRDVLELTGLTRVIPLFDSEPQAIDSLTTRN
jgi:anti-sigma B factor antagonist